MPGVYICLIPLKRLCVLKITRVFWRHKFIFTENAIFPTYYMLWLCMGQRYIRGLLVHGGQNGVTPRQATPSDDGNMSSCVCILNCTLAYTTVYKTYLENSKKCSKTDTQHNFFSF